MKNQLLLIEDVDDLGRSGDVVTTKPGYARNFLIPQKKAVVADKGTLRMQARLKEERSKRAEVDKQASEILAEKIKPMVLTMEVKVDQEGHMYGSVSALDVVRLFEELGIVIEKRNVLLPQPIRELGVHAISLKLKEGIVVSFTLKVESDVQIIKLQPSEKKETEET